MPEDWFVIGVDLLHNHLLVKCRLTEQTGIVVDPSLMEIEKASAKNFETYPWVEPLRVTPRPIKAEFMKLSGKSQRLSGILRKPPSASIHVSSNFVGDWFLRWSNPLHGNGNAEVVTAHLWQQRDFV